jgi:Na+/melibiose symporter-like transporter
MLPEDIQKAVEKPVPASLTKLKDTIKSNPASIPTIEQLQSASILQPLLSSLRNGSLKEETISTSISELQKASARAFQFALAIFCLAAMIMMYLPVIFINEKKYCESHVSNEGIFAALKSAFSNRNFLKFTFSDLTYWLSLAFIQMGISYYVITLLKLPKESASLLMTILFVLSFVFYVPINLIAQKIGKKKVLILAFVVFALDFATIFFLGKLPFSNELQGYLVVILASLPIAIFGILPNAIVADIADADGIEKGNYKAGMFFAARTFMMKLGQSIANLIFPSFLLLGQTVTNDWGIRLTGAAAFSFCVIGLLLFLMYDEKKVMRILSTKEGQSKK